MKGLYSARKKLGVTQAELGELVGIDSNTISRYERGQLNATNNTSLKIASALGVGVEELLNGPPEETWEIKIILKKNQGLEMKTVDMTKANHSRAILAVGEDDIDLHLSVSVGLVKDLEKKKVFMAEVSEKLDRAVATWDSMAMGV